LAFDSGYFNGKYVVLCDDIKTTGTSLQRMKGIIESYGAVVICALTIGMTIHE
jgi:orotate phosphoribosyltransferase